MPHILMVATEIAIGCNSTPDYIVFVLWIWHLLRWYACL